ncbi:MAG: hypothetical protein KAK00_06820 [Nanoarchaeota archaeon]|nr:hypothetical protein [Nanoarchaeota archaeon]
MADIFLFDSWYCKNPLIDKVMKRDKLSILRMRCNTKAEIGKDEERLAH